MSMLNYLYCPLSSHAFISYGSPLHYLESALLCYTLLVQVGNTGFFFIPIFHFWRKYAQRTHGTYPNSSCIGRRYLSIRWSCWLSTDDSFNLVQSCNDLILLMYWMVVFAIQYTNILLGFARTRRCRKTKARSSF